MGNALHNLRLVLGLGLVRVSSRVSVLVRVSIRTSWVVNFALFRCYRPVIYTRPVFCNVDTFRDAIVPMPSTFAERTKITDVPQGVHLDYNETFAEFYCAAISDDSTPLSIRWYKLGRHGSRSPVTNRTGRVNVTVSQDGTTLSFMVGANDTVGWTRLAGSYQAVATNGYSSEAANFSVLVDLPPSPASTTPAGKYTYKLQARYDLFCVKSAVKPQPTNQHQLVIIHNTSSCILTAGEPQLAGLVSVLQLLGRGTCGDNAHKCCTAVFPRPPG